MSYMAFVETQKLPTRRQIVIHHIEDFAVNALRQPGQRHGFRAVIHVSDRYGIAAAQMQKDAKCADAYPAGYASITGAADIARPNDHIRNPKSSTVIRDEPVLLPFREAVRVATQFRMFLNRARLVQHPRGFSLVRIDRKRTDVDEPPQPVILDTGV